MQTYHPIVGLPKGVHLFKTHCAGVAPEMIATAQ